MALITELHQTAERSRGRKGWSFLTNHGIVALVIASDPHVRMTEIAARTGLSRRAVQMIVTDLADAGCITRRRVGRRNVYTVNSGHSQRVTGLHPEPSMGDLLRLLDDGPRPGEYGSRRPDVPGAVADGWSARVARPL
jgi:DNA-binding MarR family transcriptional regulator